MYLSNENVSEQLWNEIQTQYENGDYTGVIRTAFIFLTNIIRDKSGLESDGADLINNAFSIKKPLIKINNLLTETEQSEQKGISDILRGLYLYIRNPRNHNKYEDTEDDCNTIILFINYIAEKISGSQGQFDIEIFLNEIQDKLFVEDDEYADSKVEKIPENKLYNVIKCLYYNRNTIPISNIRFIFRSLNKILNDEMINNFLILISGELTQTKSDNDMKYLINMIKPSDWQKIQKDARMRTEHRLCKLIFECNPVATWCTCIFPYFTNKQALYNVSDKIIRSRNIKSIDYYYNYFFIRIVRLIDKNEFDDISAISDFNFIWNIRSQLGKGELIHYKYLNSTKNSQPAHIIKYFKEYITKFEEIYINNINNTDNIYDPFSEE